VIHAAATMLWCRLTDLCVVFGLLLLYAGLALLPARETWLRASIFGAAALCLLAPLAASKALDLLVSTIAGARACTATPVLRRLPEELAQSVRVLQSGGPRGCCLVATLAIWLTHGWIGYLAALAVADELTFVHAALAGAASNLAFALPVTGVGGVGPPQAAWTSALQLTGASWETGVATALMAYGCLSLGSLMTAAAMLLVPAHGLRPADSLPLKSI
jgi:uncharacterized membrane protein YbhN (UPF0104 family)